MADNELKAMVLSLVETLEEAHDTHIFSENDEHDAADCSYCKICKEARELIGQPLSSKNKPVAICGICGKDDSEGTGEGGFCKNCNGDHWIELDDYLNPDLVEYILKAVDNLKTTWEDLYTRIRKLNEKRGT